MRGGATLVAAGMHMQEQIRRYWKVRRPQLRLNQRPRRGYGDVARSSTHPSSHDALNSLETAIRCAFASDSPGTDGRSACRRGKFMHDGCCAGLRLKSKAWETLAVIGAPGWDRTSNPCLRRAVLYPLSYGRICGSLAAVEHGQRTNASAGKSRRIPRLQARVHDLDGGGRGRRRCPGAFASIRCGFAAIIARYLRKNRGCVAFT